MAYARLASRRELSGRAPSHADSGQIIKTDSAEAKRLRIRIRRTESWCVRDGSACSAGTDAK
ncbi:hypothetical protein BN2476_760040 [Paraburkholderia piptadeniae]|uniref:Uncharacterized protein n=1 Tax=Paraburkholderia piptadeniae TaxID=1701573 RepID=A0A1N7SSF6_9BURK|nr:hypothetical protein BN2476_760040 [Paraburkholderia piptadeniae]